MAEALPPKEVLSPEEMENVRVGYQVAVNLWWYFGDLVWAKHNAMLVVNSVVAAAIGIALTSGQSLVILTVGLSVIGLILCALWFQLVKRGLDYLSPYIASARELEEYLGDPVEIISRGNKFNAHEEVTYQIIGADGEPFTAQMSVWGRLLRTGPASYLVIAAFAVVYVLMLIQALQ
jgi:hypothetical protein